MIKKTISKKRKQTVFKWNFEWQNMDELKQYFKEKDYPTIYSFLAENDLWKNSILLCAAIEAGDVNMVKYICGHCKLNMNTIDFKHYQYKPFYYDAFRAYLRKFSNFNRPNRPPTAFVNKINKKTTSLFEILCDLLNNREVTFEKSHLMDMQERLKANNFEYNQCVTKRRRHERSILCAQIEMLLDDDRLMNLNIEKF